MPPAAVTRARWSLMAQFALFGIVMAAWTSRMPSIRESLDITALQLGSLLVVGGVGALIGALTVGAVVARFGSRTTLTAGFVGNVIGFGLLAVSTGTGTVGVFVVGAFLNGMCGALINVPININAAAVEQRIGRSVLPHFHAAFSIGAAGGALIAAAFAWAGVGVTAQLVVVVIAVTAVRAWLLLPSTALTTHKVASGASSSARRRGGAVRSAYSAWLEPRTLLLGLVLLAASLAEGSANTWLALAVVDGFEATEAVAAVAFGTFVGAMTAFRFLGTRLIDRFGRVVVLRASGASALVGLLLFVFGPNLAIAWVGIRAVGLRRGPRKPDRDRSGIR